MITYGRYTPTLLSAFWTPIAIIISIVAGIGLFLLKEWARKLTILLLWINFLIALTNFLINALTTMQYGIFPLLYVSVMAPTIILTFFFAVLISWYLSKSGIKMAFKPETERIEVPTWEVMYCPYCGTRVSIRDNFCPKCGNRLRGAGVPKTDKNERGIYHGSL